MIPIICIAYWASNTVDFKEQDFEEVLNVDVLVSAILVIISRSWRCSYTL